MAEEDLEQTPPPETPVETPPAAGKESIYILKERYTIDFSSPMVWLDTNGAKAYKVEDKINDKRELFAPSGKPSMAIAIGQDVTALIKGGKKD